MYNRLPLFYLSVFMCAVCSFLPASGSAFTPTNPKMMDYHKEPPYIDSSEQPSTMIILDSSGSMNQFAYRSSFDPLREYYGYFEARAYYSWNAANDYFEKCKTNCTYSNAPWSGNFLNYAVMRKIDVAKQVLTGGRVDTDPSILLADMNLDRDTQRSYNDSSSVTDLNGNTRHMTPARRFVRFNFSSGQYQRMRVSGRYYNFQENVRIKVHADDQINGTVKGLIQKNSYKIRFGLTIFDSWDNDSGEGTNTDRRYNGGEVTKPVGSSEQDIVDGINGTVANSWTPLAESLYTVAGYFQQVAGTNINAGPRYATDSYRVNKVWDPFWFNNEKGYVHCSKPFVIAITDGEPTQDTMVRSSVKNQGTASPHNNTSGILENVAFWARNTDLRSDLEGIQRLDLYAVFAFGSGNLLRDAAINGSYIDKNGDGLPNSTAAEAAADLDNKEWDFDGDGTPDHYAAADDGKKLEEALSKAMSDIANKVSSGSAAAVTSSSRSGEGASYQAMFFPSYKDNSGNEVTWMGELYALFKDDHGNFREDTNGDGKLTYADDKVVEILYDDTPGVEATKGFLYTDLDGDGKLDSGEDVDGDMADHITLGLDKCDHEEDRDHDGNLDVKEDLNGNKKLDRDEDLNDNGVQDGSETDLNGDGNFDEVYEDANGNCSLDPGEDLDLDGHLDKGEDVDCDGRLDLYDEDIDGDGRLDHEEDVDQDGICDMGEKQTYTTVDLFNIKFLWSAGTELSKKMASQTKTQGTYQLDSTWDHNRTILTAFDSDNDGWVKPVDMKEFSASGVGDSISAVSNVYTYFHLPLGGDPDFDYDGDGDTADDFDDLEMLINYIRGTDDAAFRSREIWFDHDGNGNDETQYTWRLGDIISSSPVSVTMPAENFDLRYDDNTYRLFAKKYRKRRNVIYVGANDGMLHAFNGGFYDKHEKKVWRYRNPDYNPYDQDTTNDVEYQDIGPELGEELWAYIPYNALPHLQWLARGDYLHTYFVDMEPRIADVQIFEEESDCQTDGIYDKDCIHPNGWGTILIGGMRFGGGPIAVDSNDDGVIDNNDAILSSSFFVLDITNPEQKPTLLGEFNFDSLNGTMGDDFSFTTSDPTVVMMKSREQNNHYSDWYIVFGTGPTTLEAQSDQRGKIYALKLAQDPKTNGLGSWVVRGSGGEKWFAEIPEEDSFISDLTSADFELGDGGNGSYHDDVIYFGSVAGGYDEDLNDNGVLDSSEADLDNDGQVDSGWSGSLYRISLYDDKDNSKWFCGTKTSQNNANDPFLEVGKPISTAPVPVYGRNDNIWVVAGTGRYLDALDADNPGGQMLFGVMEPKKKKNSTSFEWVLSEGKVGMSELLDVTFAKVYSGNGMSQSPVTGISELSSPAYFSDLVNLIGNDPTGNKKRGWKKELINASGAEKEQVINSPVAFGGAVFSDTYAPSTDVCTSAGKYWVYGLYYLTGTAYYKPIFGVDDSDTTGGAPRCRSYIGPRTGRGGGITIDGPSSSKTVKINVRDSEGGTMQREVSTPQDTFSGRVFWRPEL